LTLNGHIQRVLREGDVTLREFLRHTFQQHALSDGSRSILQRRGSEDVTKFGAGLLEAHGTDVRDVVADDSELSFCSVEARQGGIE